MLIRTGIDIIEIDRIQKISKKPRFISKYFSPDEIRFFITRRFSPYTIAANFCTKEAFAKALGTGVRGFSLSEVSVLRDSIGSPYLSLSGKARAIAEREKLTFSISISHSKQYATAIVIAYQK